MLQKGRPKHESEENRMHDCERGKAATKRSSETYHHMVTGEGLSAKEKAKQKVPCQLCGTEVQRASMKSHQATKKCQRGRETYENKDREEIPREVPSENAMTSEPKIYEFCMPTGKKRPCPVEGCPFKEDNKCRM